jgi:hypothetical protein
MGRVWLAITMLVAGCFDFDLLKRPLGDLSTSRDLSSENDDLAGEDLAGSDFAKSDANPCGPPPAVAANVFYVAPNATGDGKSAASPAGSIQAAVQLAQQAAGPAAILIASGTYTEVVSITGGFITLYGGLDAAFKCRDATQPPVTRLVAPAAMSGLTATNGTFTLDRMTVVGGGGIGPTLGAALTLDGTSGTVNGTIRDSELRSHEPLTTQVTNAYAVNSRAATLTIDHSHLIAGATNGSVSPSVWGLYLCSSTASVTDSLIETDDPASMHGQIAIHLAETTCGPGAITPGLEVVRSTLSAHGSGGANMALFLGLTGVTPSFQSSALVAPGGSAVVGKNSANAALALSFIGSTVNAPGAGTRAINIGSMSPLDLTIKDTILTALIPISLGTAGSGLTVHFGGVNLLHGSTSTVLAAANGSYDIAAYRTSYDATAVDMDPMLATDYIHLLPGSPAVDLTQSAVCSTPRDIDGEMRPKGSFCDVGADEL